MANNNNRSLWLVHGIHDDDDKNKNKNNDDDDDDDGIVGKTKTNCDNIPSIVSTSSSSSSETYETLFIKFSSNKPTMRPLKVIISNSLVIGQEFILSCFVLASHRVALSTTTSQNNNGNKFPLFEERFSISLFLIWATFIFVVWMNWSSQPSTSRKNKLKYRTTDAIFMGILLRYLASVLQTLTASYSSDTVHSLAISTLFLHLLACDYSYANGIPPSAIISNNNDQQEHKQKNNENHNNHNNNNEIKRPTFQGGTLSLTAAFFATILLASRLEDNNNLVVYIFVSSSVILFALYPAARHQVATNTCHKTRWKPILITTTLLGIATFLLLHPIEQIYAGIVLFVLCCVVPIWTYFLQYHKRVLRGPWDIAHVN